MPFSYSPNLTREGNKDEVLRSISVHEHFSARAYIGTAVGEELVCLTPKVSNNIPTCGDLPCIIVILGTFCMKFTWDFNPHLCRQTLTSGDAAGSPRRFRTVKH